MKSIITFGAIALLIYGIVKIIPSVFWVLANRAFADGDKEKAMKHYKTASEIFGGSANNKITYALMLMRVGRYAEAELILNNIILYSGVKPNVKYTAKAYRCMAYQKQGRLDDALEDAEELFERFKSTTTYGMLGYLRQLKGGAELDFCKEAYDYNSDDRDICDNLAVAYIRMGEFDKAAEITKDLREKFPEFTEGFYHSAIVALKKGDKKAAEEHIDAIKDCSRTAMTTVSEEEIDRLREEIKNA